MAQSSTESPSPFDITRISLPLRTDDGQVRIVELPAELGQPSRFSAAERERLTRA